MFANLSKIPIKLGILLVGFGLLVAGCDSTGPSAQKDENTENPYTVTNDLGTRITDFGDDGSTNSVTSAAAKAPSFTVTHWVQPPDKNGDGNNDRASHLSLEEFGTNNYRLYVGYKVQGSGYGGGIDVVNANNSGLSDSGNNSSDALEADGLDIQELAVASNDEALFVATADDPESGFSSPSQFHSIDLDPNNGLPNTSSGDVQYEETEFSGALVKSVTGGSGNSNYDAFAVSNVNTFHQINIDSDYGIDGVDVTEASSGTNFRSVANQNGTAYALSDGGNIYAFGGLGAEPPLNDSPLGTIGGNNIARMSAHQVDVDGSNSLDSDEWFLFVALNDGGFRVFDTSQGQNGEVVYSDTDIYATSVTATPNYVYVATGDGIGLYKVQSTLTSNNTSEGLEDVGRASVSDFDINSSNGVPTPTNAQVNHIEVFEGSSQFSADDNVLFLAKSTDGVFRVEQNASSGDY